MQIDRRCTCGSEVIDVSSLNNYSYLKNRVFNFSSTKRVKQNQKKKKIKNHSKPYLVCFLVFHWHFNPFAPSPTLGV